MAHSGNIFSASPLLQTLTLINLSHPISSIASDALSPNWVELPELRDLTVYSLPPEMAHMILASVYVPNCWSLRIKHEQLPNDTYGFLTDPIVQHLTSRISAFIAASKRHIDVECYSHQIRLLLRNSMYELFDITFVGNWRLVSPDGLANALGKGGSAEVSFEICDDCLIVGVQPLLLSRCHTTSIVAASGTVTMNRALLRFLTEPITTNDGRIRWPVADL
ncbi:hypothetical protein FRB94_009232 [Tulasnella sp. JGI-2019a]|nr:hypothetical protein FRB94_009232 [Tulasnella sp. JGI-2019a]